MTNPAAVEAFLQRWHKATGGERANHQLFVTELCDLLDLPRPDPATEDNAENAYVFERLVTFHNPDGSHSRGFIDCYRRGSFILEAKATGEALGSGRWDGAMLRAHGQAVAYARALPREEGRPPFVITLDVGVALELHSEFSQTGGAYIPFPDPSAHRIPLAELRRPEIQDRLRQVWLEPLALDPTRISARVTRDIADRLATLAKSLEASGHPPEAVASFLMRAIFTMFAEDVGLLANHSFTELLQGLQQTPEHFAPLIEELWRTMNSGGFSTVLRQRLPRFNGGLFRDAGALDLDRPQIELLIAAARADWKQVEPAIFGTLLERALDPHERHKLGAHYTPRAYVERLVLPTVIQPLREEWENTLAAALLLDQQGKHPQAVAAIEDFHGRLCQLRILDPACGSGNFLYVTLEHLKRLEGEVFNALEQLGEQQLRLAGGGLGVDPHQFLGIETNPRAAAIAESVIWIGYLQWHFKTQPGAPLAEPVLRDFHNIENRDAVLAWERIEAVSDDAGHPVTRWDGRTYKTHPVTGEEVPDDSARVPLERYVHPRKAAWPEADFVVGNPPFIGAGRMRAALGDGYAEALRGAWPEVPESADFVMYWWHQAADLTRAGRLRRFGFITTNSLRQTFSRRVIQHHLEQKNPLSLLYAVPDHPWVDAGDGAAVRIAMSVGLAGDHPGVLEQVIAERDGEGEGREVDLKRQTGKLFADLKVGADVAGCGPLVANGGLSHEGVKLHGMGFVVTKEEAKAVGLGRVPGIEKHIRRYLNGRDLAQSSRDVLAIDLFGLTAEETRSRFPEVYQWLLERVKPERDAKGGTKDGAGYAKLWWLFGKPRQEMRKAMHGLSRYIATVKTAKHRLFVMLESDTIADSKLIVLMVA
jgi:hypothetical protein